MKPILYKENRKIRAFISTQNGQYFYAFGSPSQAGGYIAFMCSSLEVAKEKLENLLKWN